MIARSGVLILLWFAAACAEESPDWEAQQVKLEAAHAQFIAEACWCYGELWGGLEQCRAANPTTSAPSCVVQAYQQHPSEAVEWIACRRVAVDEARRCLSGCPADLTACLNTIDRIEADCASRTPQDLLRAVADCQ